MNCRAFQFELPIATAYSVTWHYLCKLSCSSFYSQVLSSQVDKSIFVSCLFTSSRLYKILSANRRVIPPPLLSSRTFLLFFTEVTQNVSVKCQRKFRHARSKNASPCTYRAVTKALIGGGCIFIYSRSARRISFEINCNDNWFQKKFVGQNANIWISTPPPINVLVTALCT